MDSNHDFVGANLYGVLPAAIRYNKDLELEAKLLYTEITALFNADGYFITSLDYFFKHFPGVWTGDYAKDDLMLDFYTLQEMGVIELETIGADDEDNPMIKVSNKNFFLGIPEDYFDE